MTCGRCGSKTTRTRRCRECARLDADTTPATDGGVADCGQCGEPAPEGSYAERTPGLWLCADCHPEGDGGRQPMEVGR